MKPLRKLFAVTTALLTACGIAQAVPPPPPAPDVTAVTQAYIRALRMKDVNAYSDTLSDVAGITEAGRIGALGKQAWMGEIAKTFANQALRIDVKDVFQTSILERGQLVELVMLVETESISTVPPAVCDNCNFYRTETLTIEGGKIVRIDLSANYHTELSPDGKRLD